MAAVAQHTHILIQLRHNFIAVLLQLRALMPKARERFAEFLDQDSLDRLGILYLTTSVGLGYGRQRA